MKSYLNKKIILLLAVLLCSCDISKTSQDVIDLPGTGDKDKDYAMAEEIGKKVWAGNLKNEIRKKIPNLWGRCQFIRQA